MEPEKVKTGKGVFRYSSPGFQLYLYLIQRITIIDTQIREKELFIF